MDHEVVPRHCKIFDWLLNLSRDHFGLHQGENVRVTMEFEVPRRHILRPTLSIDMVQQVLWWEWQKRCSGRKRQGPMAKKYCYKKSYWIFCSGREDEDKRRQKNGQSWISFKTTFFGHIIKKINTFIFWCMVIPLGLHSIYTQWGAQRLCKLIF